MTANQFAAGVRESTGELATFEVGVGPGGMLGLCLKEKNGREHWLEASPALCEVGARRLIRMLDELRGAGVTWSPDQAELDRLPLLPVDQCLKIVDGMGKGR